MDQARNNDQTSNIQALESDPATLMVNLEDSNSHTLTQLASEAVTNTPQSAIPDIDRNMNRDDSTNNELGSELATKRLHSPSDWQKKWIHRFNNIADSIQLEEILTEFIEETKLPISDPRHLKYRHGANHRHGDCHSFIINSESNIDGKKNNTMQPPPHVSRNCTAIHGPEPLEK